VARLAPLVLVVLAGVRVAFAAPALQDAAERLVGAEQGVYAVAEDGTVLASVAAARAVHPASVTKVATTLALLERLGPTHRFETRVLRAGALRDGTLHGDLVVRGGGDPALVFEDAFLILRALRDLGLHRVDGALAVQGDLLFNWQPDVGGARLRRALAGLDGREAWAALPPDGSLAAAALTFGRPRPAPVTDDARLLLVLRSPPLVRIVKALDGYSNNVLHLASAHVGGAAAVERSAREHVGGELAAEVVIDNAAGAGETNRLSPRAAVALVRALEREVAGHGLTLPDVLPVVGVDEGTLRDRLEGVPGRAAVIGKTGTFGSLGASALAGQARTRRWGVVTFAVLNHGIAVPEARRRQDAFVRALLEAGEPIPWPPRPPDGPLVGGVDVERSG
jgi:D-alanyl-D-alanine carboxypeptidase